MESKGLTVNLSEAFHDRSNVFHAHVPPIVVHAQLHGQWHRGEELCTFAFLRISANIYFQTHRQSKNKMYIVYIYISYANATRDLKTLAKIRNKEAQRQRLAASIVIY